ncbi:unnamed protein product [Rotaria sp. Silwood2]|nr:unnamed protein product [Rotaria sp. Silwood2]CAF4594104.1 unnamed protein product [Rotaria sp. Silwood2]
MTTDISLPLASDIWSCIACTSLNPLSTFPMCQICETDNDSIITVSTAGNWSCAVCTYINGSTTQHCEICGNIPNILPSIKNEDDGRWECPCCTYDNSKYIDTCIICERGTQRHMDKIMSDVHNNCLHNSQSSLINSFNSLKNDTMIDRLLTATNDHTKIAVADPQAFNNGFVEQRQQAINTHFYRKTVESWNPHSLQQLVETMKVFSKDYSRANQCWLSFCWIAYNIGYDTVSYFSKNYPDQSVEEVFRTKKAICGGYSNLYKYLCDQLAIPCKVISGYAKGYGFEHDKNALYETNHAWNAVEIEQSWYLIDSTWGSGYLDKHKLFKRHLNPYYFLSRPDQMIYNHLPENEIWQLLQRPISRTQYMQMPEVYPAFFEFNIELISPRQQAHVALILGQPYGLVLIRAPANIELTAHFNLFDKKVNGGCRIIFDSKKELYLCYFAPNRIGKHDITIFGMDNDSVEKLQKPVLHIPFDVTEMIQNPVSFPMTTKAFYDLNLEVLSPKKTHLIKVDNGTKTALIMIRAPYDVELVGHLQDKSQNNIANAHSIYYDKQEGFWKCYFAPNENGMFDAHIFARKQSNTQRYTLVVTFQIEAKEISKSPLTYPHMWQLFHDLNLEVESPKNCSTIIWSKTVPYVEILMRASNNVQLTCSIHNNDVYVENGTLAQFNRERNLWQLLFAPQRTGEHKLNIFAKQMTSVKSAVVVQFNMHVTELQRPMKFPIIYSHIKTSKIRIYEPIDGTLKKGSTVLIHCMIPNATDVFIMVDSKSITPQEYQNSILKTKLIVGSKDVVVYAKYEQGAYYESVIAYFVG